MEQQGPRLFCRVLGRRPAALEIVQDAAVEYGQDVDGEGIRNLAFCLCRVLTPDQVMGLVYHLQSWLRFMVLQSLYEEGVSENRWLQVLLKDDPLGLEYRYVEPGEVGSGEFDRCDVTGGPDELDEDDQMEFD